MAPAQELTLAAISLTAGPNKAQNIEAALAYVAAAAKAGADWVQLPETFPFVGTYDQAFDKAEEQGGPLYTQLSEAARQHKIVLFAGSVGERPRAEDPLTDNERRNNLGQRRVYNTSYVFGRGGELLAKYRKIHLFNLNGDDGRPRYCESDGFLPGKDVVSLTIDGLRVGLAICYDLRFPEMFAQFEPSGFPDVLVIPSAFTKGTGLAHWELLLRARAVERQAFVFAANQTGVHAPGKESYGHSLVIDPWGTVLADSGDAPGLAVARIKTASLADVRGRLPALRNRRLAPPAP